MKKIITYIILMISACTGAPAQDKIWYRTGFSNGIPTANPTQTPSFRYANQDTTTGKGYIWDNVVKKWIPADGILKGTKGDQGVPGENGVNGAPGKDGLDGADGAPAIMQIGAVTTLPPNSQSTATITAKPNNTYELNLGLVKGQDGQGGGTVRGFLFPAPCNCQTGADDATLQSAFNNAAYNTIVLTGAYYITKGLKRNKLTNTIIQGNGSTITTLNNNPYAVIGAESAASETEANQMQNYSLEITNLTISCQSNQVGVEPEPSSNNYFRKVIVAGGQTAFKLEFNLKAYLHGCLALGSTNGFWIGTGGFPGATINNSQSNVVELVQCHNHSVTNYGFDISHSYHIVLDNCVNEGNNSVKRAVNVEVANSTTTKDFEIRSSFHHEQIGGATEAIVYLNLGNNCTAEITNVIGHYSGLVVWAKSFGTGLVIVNRCPYAVGKNGKMFKSENMTWSFNYNSIIYPYAYNVWDGTAPTYCPTVTGSACGNNAFNFIGVIPR